MKKCIYCNQEKISAEFSLEHIFPDSLGGVYFSDIFKTRQVCRKCNSTSGLFIDGPFIKNFFSQSDKCEAALKFLDLSKPSPLPMRYAGVLKNIHTPEDKECDFWMGPHGGLVYHVRKKADPKWDRMIGGNPIERKKEKGTAYIYGQNQDSYWVAVLLLSCLENFKGTKFISGNIGLPPTPHGEQPYFDDPNKEDEEMLQQIWGLQGKSHQCNFAIENGFEQRFTAKFALGFGANLFGNAFLYSDYANCLRNALWEKDLQQRIKCGVQFYKYLGTDKLLKFLSIDGAHTVVLYPEQETLYLIIFIYGKNKITIPLCHDESIWGKITQKGLLFIAAPQVQKFIGPIDIIDYIAYTGGIKKISEIDELHAKKFDVSKLPKIT